MYWRTCSNSKPTVDTAYPRAQKCSPVKFRSLPHSRATAIALFPLRNPITEATGGLGGWEYAYARDPASDGLPRSGTPSAGPAGGRFPQVSARLSEQYLAPLLRTTHIIRTFFRPPPFTIVGIPFLECLSVLLNGCNIGTESISSVNALTRPSVRFPVGCSIRSAPRSL